MLVQGDAPKNELLARFQKAGNAVLLGSQSFWEGVDMPGDVLSVVIIDKLPFQPPDDPVVAARIAQAEKNGGKPFMDHQLPHAAISLKQGAGRLIRSETDRGVLTICDTRLADKPYGRCLLNALPAITRTRGGGGAVLFASQELRRHCERAATSQRKREATTDQPGCWAGDVGPGSRRQSLSSGSRQKKYQSARQPIPEIEPARWA